MEVLIMRLIEWEVSEDGYEEQIVIPKEKRDLAAEEGINTENEQKVDVKAFLDHDRTRLVGSAQSLWPNCTASSPMWQRIPALQ
jgi:hypothetical protein